ncbi:RnfABCDGE type electron transport complex subunit B [Enterococcus sp. LJL90]
MFESIFYPVLLVGLLGLIAGIGLSIATIVFRTPEDPKETELRAALPGINCGACGFSGCDGYAKAMAADEAGGGLCTPGGADTQEKLAAILGETAGSFQKTAAFVRCNGLCQFTQTKMDYQGAKTCYAANQVFGGQGACQQGCLGYGDCLVSCDYDAIEMIDGVAKIKPNKCVGCLKCISACPKLLIKMLPAENTAIVACSNTERGGGVKKICSVGCITCSKCIKVCPENAIEIVDNLAVITPDLCTNCGECVTACPQNCILQMQGTTAVAKEILAE